MKRAQVPDLLWVHETLRHRRHYSEAQRGLRKPTRVASCDGIHHCLVAFLARGATDGAAHRVDFQTHGQRRVNGKAVGVLALHGRHPWLHLLPSACETQRDSEVSIFALVARLLLVVGWVGIHSSRVPQVSRRVANDANQQPARCSATCVLR